jgi:hypothetical protein
VFAPPREDAHGHVHVAVAAHVDVDVDVEVIVDVNRDGDVAVIAKRRSSRAFGAPGTLAAGAGGWLIKLDSGLKSGLSQGMLLRCEARSLTAGARPGAAGECRALTPDGALRPLPVR